MDADIDPSSSRDPARLRAFARLSGFYAATYAALGVYMQFFPVWLHDVGGLTHEQVTKAQSGQIVARTIAGPLWAQHVERRGRPARAVVLLTVASIAAFALFGLGHGLPWLFACCVIYGCCYPPLHAIFDNLAVATARQHGFRYPRVRLWGSAAFLVVIVLVGALLERVSSAIVYWLLLALLTISLGAAWLLPESDRPANKAVGAPMGRLLGQGRFVLFLVGTALLQGSHGAYYSLSTLYWRSNGIGEGLAGVLWAEGITAEIALFFWIRDAAERLRPTTLLLFGAAGAVVRWLCLAMTVDPVLIAAVNWLHMFSFGCTWLGSLQWLRLRVAEDLQTTAQGLLAAATSGVGMVLGTWLAGRLYGSGGAPMFAAMAGMAALGGLLALLLRRSRSAFWRDEVERRASTSSNQTNVTAAPSDASCEP